MTERIYLKAYIAGALRDGYIGRYVERKNSKEHWVLRIYSKDVEWLNELVKILKYAYGFETNVIIPHRGIPYIEKYSKKIVEHIAKELNHPIGKSINWDTPMFIKNTNDKGIWRYYIAGFFDAEGGVDITKKQLKIYQSWRGEVCPPLMDIKDKMLTLFGIESGEVSRYPNRRYNPRFVVRIKKKYTYMFYKTFPLLNPSKINKIKLII